MAQRNGERLTALIDDLLMLTRFDAGRIDFKSEPVDLAEQLRNLRQEMEPVADKGDTRLRLDAPGGRDRVSGSPCLGTESHSPETGTSLSQR